MKSAVAFWILVAPVLPARAEVLGLKDCLKMALARSFSVPQAGADREIAGLAWQASLAPFYPQLSLSGSEIGLGDAISGSRIGDPLRWDPDTYTGSLNANWNFFNSFRDLVGAAKSRSGVEASDQSLRQARQDLALSVVDSYYGLLKQRKLAEVQASQLKQRQETAKQAEDLYRDGSRSYTDLLGAQSAVRSEELSLLAQGFEASKAQTRLAALLGLEPSADLELKDERGVRMPAPDPAASWAEARKGRPDLLRLGSEEAQGRLAYDLAFLEELPALRLDGSYTKNLAKYGLPQSQWVNQGLFEENGSWNLVLSLNYSFFQGFGGRAQLGQARLVAEKAGLALGQALRDAEVEVRLASQQLAQDLKALDLNAALKASARQTLEELRRRYARGVSSYLELFQASTDALSAETSEVNAVYDYQVDLARWEKALGREVGGDLP
jgi:outer membrane protein TolC